MALVFGRDGVCSLCIGRGWRGRRPDGTSRPAYPAELAAHARGESARITPCRTCGATGIVHFRPA